MNPRLLGENVIIDSNKKGHRFFKLGFVLGTLFLVSLVLFQSSAQAALVGIFDIDGTVFNDLTGENGAWRTEWIMVRSDERSTVAEHDPRLPFSYKTKDAAGKEITISIPLPEEILVSADEYHRFRGFWAQGSGRLSSFSPVELDFDPLNPKKQRIIVPGFYHVAPTRTWAFHRTSEDGIHHMPKDYLAAEQREKLSEGKLTLDGPAMPLLKSMFSSKVKIPVEVIFSTQRGQDSSEVFETLDLMKKSGRLERAAVDTPSKDGVPVSVHMLSSADGRLFGQSFVERKATVVEDWARQLLVSSAAKHKELHPDPVYARQGVEANMHTIIVPENDVRYIDAIERLLARLSSENRFAQNIKFVLFNAAKAKEVVSSARWKAQWTVFYRGLGRPALPEEIGFWTSQSTASTQSQVFGACGSSLSADALATLPNSSTKGSSK